MQLTVEKVRLFKGAPLSILMAMVLIRQPVTAEWLETATGYTDKTLTKGLKMLAEFGYITRNGRYAWQICGDVQQLPLMMALPGFEPAADDVEDMPDRITEPAAADPDWDLDSGPGNSPGPENITQTGVGKIPGPGVDAVGETAQNITIVDNSVDKNDPNVDNLGKNLAPGDDSAVGVGEFPGPGDSLARLESLTSLDSRNDSRLARADAESEIFRVLDDFGIREPARSKITGIPGITARAVQYHCKTAPNIAMAIYRIKNNWRVPKDWMPQEVLFFPDSTPEPVPPAEILDPIPEELRGLWAKALVQLETELSRADFNTWLKPAQPRGMRAGEMILNTANPIGKAWLESHVVGRLESILGVGVTVEV